MAALNNLFGGINQFLGVAENTPRNLDGNLANDPNTIVNFGALGDFANKIDKSAKRQYVETGYIRNIRPNQSEILMQEPNITVLVKKRMFSSLAENFKPELMDVKEKLFYRASKKLFQNKCSVIAAYEKLSKLDRVIANGGVVNDYMFPVIFSGIDILSASGINIVDAKTKSILDTLKKVKFLSDPKYKTTWVTTSELPALSDIGDGTGVIDFTNISSINCSTSVIFGQGSASLTIEDPYKLLLITSQDIEKAIRESAGGFLQNAFFKVTESQLEETIDRLRQQLNNIRASRGATDIRFFINEDALLFRKVRAIIDEEGREINFNYDGGLSGIGSDVDIDASAFIGVNGLNNQNKEVDIFKQVLKNIYILMGSKKSTQINSFQFNKETNYVRKKMKLHFCNKSLIQSMDVINIFISTKSAIDTKSATVLANSFGGNSILNSINSTVGSVENTLDNISSSLGGNNYGQTYANAEKDAIAGVDFPMWLWNIVKNDFTRQAAGTHVFAGIVQRPQHEENAGKYTLTISATDNCGYFKFGQININPSVEVFNNALYDPLTPRELNFDSSSGFLTGEEPPLLPENILLLNSGLLKFKNGRFRGYPANEEIYNSFDIEKIKNSSNRFSVRKKYEDPDGLVYRWKEGIQSLTLLGEPHPTGEFPSDSSPSLTKNPFAGQDVMNVLSLLVTGSPYNFNSFLKAAVSSGALNRDDLLNDGGSKSFFKGLLNDISKQNATWGNFIPFKKLVVNESAYNFLRSGQFDITTSNQQITALLKERAQRFDTLVKAAPFFANNPQYLNVDINGNLVNSSNAIDGVNSSLNSSIADATAITKLSSDIIKLDFQIEQARKAFEDSINSPNINTNDGSIQIFGDDISFDPTVTQGQSYLTPDDIIRERSEFRKRLNYLTQRRLWKVKANEDQNLFIVDDSYDKNYDIQAFEKGLAGSLELFKSNYTDVANQIIMVSDILGIEIFADSQGHIQARPPQYNRMPSSVFYKMIQDKNLTGIQIFPSYLESLFTNQIKGLADKIEIIEDEIRIRAAALGYVNDQSAKTLLSGFVTGGGNTNFGFVTNESDGKFGGKDIRVLLDQVNPDFDNQGNSSLKSIGTTLNNINKIIKNVKAGVNFDIVQRINVINKTEFGAGASEEDINDKISQIGDRLQSNTGQPAPTKADLLSTDTISQGLGRSQLDVLNLSNQIAQFLSQRQSSLKLMSNAVKNLGDGIDLNTSQDSGRTALLPFINKSKSFPEILEHMIEDEDIDDLGYGSGKRYIIKNHQIISLQVSEEPPQHTIVEVTGLFADGLVDPPGGFDTGGGNPITTAWAVDFDMWNMYGFKSVQTVQAPFLSNPETQCAPYAVFLLNKARKEIFQGDLTIAGNEFMQPGEVYYIEDRDLLYYSERVSHNFSYGGSYTTAMSLKYGHNPGEYIPTILDIVGKGLYTNKNQADLSRHNRHGISNGDIPINTIVFDNRPDFEPDPIRALVEGSYGDQNRKSLANALLSASGALTPTIYDNKAKIELRTYFDSKTGGANSSLNNLASSIKTWLVNPTKTNIGSEELLPDHNADEINNVNIDLDSIKVIQIDLSDLSDARSPSQGALNRAKEIAATSGVLSSESTEDNINIDPIKDVLFTKIVDIWVTFEGQTQVSQISKTPDKTPSELAQQNLEQSLSAFAAKIKSQAS
jgi:hypothetical protein